MSDLSVYMYTYLYTHIIPYFCTCKRLRHGCIPSIWAAAMKRYSHTRKNWWDSIGAKIRTYLGNMSGHKNVWASILENKRNSVCVKEGSKHMYSYKTSVRELARSLIVLRKRQSNRISIKSPRAMYANIIYFKPRM